MPLHDAGVLDFVDDDGEVMPGVSVWRTGGHTMHHQMVRIESGGRTAVFAADLIPTTAHVDRPWIMGYDLYPMDTLAFKQRVRARGDRRASTLSSSSTIRRWPPASSANRTAGVSVEPVDAECPTSN